MAGAPPPYNPAVIAIAARASLALWLAVAAAVTALYGGSAMDDFFITYRYADNLGDGRGFVLIRASGCSASPSRLTAPRSDCSTR